MKEIRRRGGTLRTLAVFTFGATAGSIIALLYAPASGKVTRRRLAIKAKQLQREAMRRVGQTKRVLATQAEHVREAATEWISEHVPHRNGRHFVHHRTIRHAHATN